MGVRLQPENRIPLGLTLVLLLTGVLSTTRAAAAELRLSLKQAVEMALSEQGNSDVQAAEEIIREVQARSRLSRAPLLPNLEGSMAEQGQVRNLAASGLQKHPRPSLHPGKL